MPLRIEDYAIIGDTKTAALVGRDGSIDWWCPDRFDSQACFAALVGTAQNGFWRIAPKDRAGRGGTTPLLCTSRRYIADTLVLETDFVTPTGKVRVTDCMPLPSYASQIVRVVEGISGSVEMRMDLVVRFGYGDIVPWVQQHDGMVEYVAGPDALALWTPVQTRGENMTTVGEFTISAGQQVPFILSHYPSHAAPPHPLEAGFSIARTAGWWQNWASMTTCKAGPWREAVVRSAITLKALTYAPTGGIVAAVTTSLPEAIGGTRNWDYRYCWLRDATLTLAALIAAGFHEEAIAWRDWLLRAVAGDPSKLQIMYGPAGERTLVEREIEWLSGYENSKPVRLGNEASTQFQLDVYGEVLSALHESRRFGMDPAASWDLECALLEFVETGWRLPDDGIWEVRGGRRHFTHSKVMAWLAMDRAVKDVEEFGFQGPVEKWRAIRDEIKNEVLEKGYDPVRKTFTQYYGSTTLDASVLMIPLVGFLPPTDPRVIGTIEAIERHLTVDGYVQRYDADNSENVDGISGREGAFLACSFWMVDNLELIGRHDDALVLFEKLLSLRNDVGLLAEEFDVATGRQVGNFPQAFSHISLVNSAVNLSDPSTWNNAELHRHLARAESTPVALPAHVHSQRMSPA